MAGPDPRESAKIYDLSAFRRTRTAARIAAEAKPAPTQSFGGGAWYHDVAIRQDEQPRRS